MKYTTINKRDHIIKRHEDIKSALLSASIVWEGAGIKVELRDTATDKEIKYSFDSRLNAYLDEVE